MQHPDSSHVPDPNPHSTHDVALIAGHAAGDLVDSERSRAEAQVRACEPCAELHADLVAIVGATKALPTLARAPRDFRLSPVQAASLQRGSWLRTLLRPFGASGSAVKPFAAAFTSAGVAGLLVAAVLPGLLGGGASMGAAPERDSVPAATGGSGAGAVASAAPALAPQAGAPGPTTKDPNDRSTVTGALGAATSDPGEYFGVKDGASQTAEPIAIAGAPASPASEGAPDDLGTLRSSTPPNPILIGSVVLLGVGLALFGLRFASRRLR